MFSRIRNHPVVASLILLGTVSITLLTLTNAARNLLNLVDRHTRPDINGQWKAEITYDWANARLTETFTFDGDGDTVHGTASFLGTKKWLSDGMVKNDEVQFTTKTLEILGPGEPRHATHHYLGRFDGDEIKFIVLTEGGYSQHQPIEFIAKKVSAPDSKSAP